LFFCCLNALSLLFFSSATFAGSLNVNMSNTAAQIEGGISTDAKGEIQAGVLYNDQGSMMINTGLIVKGGGEDAASGLVVGGGVKAIAAQTKQAGVMNTASCIAIGGQATLTPKATSSVDFVLEYFSSLKITTYGDADRYNQFALRMEVGPPHAKIFIGYREFTFDIKNVGGISVEKSSYMGLLMTF
jgi:hypothetical protein